MRIGSVAAFVLVLAGCLGPAARLDVGTIELGGRPMPDPAIPGPFPVQRFDYDLGYMSVTEPRTMVVPFPSHLVGNVHYPATDQGPFPVVLFLHGRHSTCGVREVGIETLGPVLCPDTPATYPVDSYTGYDYVASELASHGYVVLSASANNINDLDQQYGDSGATSRAQLILRTLDDFQTFNATAGPEPIGSRLVGKMDFSRVGLMGHSRGGEGVTRAITFNRDRTDGPPHAIRAVFALAPTDFSRWPAPDVAFATLLPYCDGDVSNLQGAWIYDDARYLRETTPSPKIQILAFGSNHNYYNTVWTGNDGGRFSTDAHCSAVRENQKGEFVFLGPEDQRRHGLVFLSAFFRAYVGGETEFRPLFTGELGPPPSACPAARTNCSGMIHVSYHAPAPARLVVEDTLNGDTLFRNDLGGDNRFTGFSNRTVCLPASCPTKPTYAGASQLVLGWDRLGAEASFRFAPQDVRGFDVVSLRVGVAGGDPRNAPDEGQDFRILLQDSHGRTSWTRAGAWSHALFEPPGGTAQKTTLNMVAIPLSAFDVDRSAVVEIRLLFEERADGLVHLTDLQFQARPD